MKFFQFFLLIVRGTSSHLLCPLPFLPSAFYLQPSSLFPCPCGSVAKNKRWNKECRIQKIGNRNVTRKFLGLSVYWFMPAVLAFILSPTLYLLLFSLCPLPFLPSAFYLQPSSLFPCPRGSVAKNRIQKTGGRRPGFTKGYAVASPVSVRV